MTLLAVPTDAEIAALAGLDPAQAEFGEGTVYLLHLHRRYVAQTGKGVKFYQHYIGHAAPGCLASRLREHGTSNGARVMAVAREAGITWHLARTWPGGYDRERKVKAQGGASRFCPSCGVTPRRKA